MPTPATAPPSVMVFSCGTTAGMTPCARQRAVEVLVRDHAFGLDRALRSTASTWLNPRTSSRRRARRSRSRNRLEVSLASATGPGARALSDCASGSRLAACAASASAMPEAARRRFGRLHRRVPVKEVARHRVARWCCPWRTRSGTDACARRASGTSRRSRRGTRARCGGSARRSAAGRARGCAPSCGRSARPRRRASARSGGAGSRCRATSRPAFSISTITSARLGIQPPGNTYLRMKNSVS